MAASTRISFAERIRAACEMVTSVYEEFYGTPWAAARARGRPAGAQQTPATSTKTVSASGADDILEVIRINPNITRQALLPKLGGNWNGGRLQLALNRFVKQGALSETGQGDNRTYTATGVVPQPTRRRAA
jgi:hypothetical protein